MSVDRQSVSSADVVARAVRRMTPELREQYNVVRKLLATTTAADARTRYRVGVVVLEIKRSEDRHGTGAVALLASALCRSEATLYRYSAVAEAWTAKEVEEILLERMPGGEPISWCHLQEIAISPREKRESLLRKTIAKGLSLRELTELARGERAKVPHVGGADATPGRPLAELEHLATAWEATEQLAIDDSLLERVLSANPERAGEIVERTLAAQSKALHLLEKNIAHLQKAAAALPAAGAKKTAPRSTERNRFPRLLCGGVA